MSEEKALMAGKLLLQMSQNSIESLQQENAALKAQLKWEREENERVSNIATKRAEELEVVKAENDRHTYFMGHDLQEIFDRAERAEAELASLKSQDPAAAPKEMKWPKQATCEREWQSRLSGKLGWFFLQQRGE